MTAPPPDDARTSRHGPTWLGPASPLRRYGLLVVAVLAFLVFRALTVDDGSRDVTVGQCVAGEGADAVRTVGCEDPSALGRVVHVGRDVFTDDASVRRLCAAHGSTRAFTSADSRGGAGTVLCLVAASP